MNSGKIKKKIQRVQLNYYIIGVTQLIIIWKLQNFFNLCDSHLKRNIDNIINDNNNTCCVSAFVDSDTDDYFQVQAFQNSGGDAAVGGFQAISYFLGFRIGT